jgi:hypothetical protein
MGNSTTLDRRQAATARYAIAAAAINTVFDRCDELRDYLARLSDTALGADPLRAAVDVVQLAERLAGSLEAVITAAADASEHRSKGDLANDLGTRLGLLFPRARTSDDEPSGMPNADEVRLIE